MRNIFTSQIAKRTREIQNNTFFLQTLLCRKDVMTRIYNNTFLLQIFLCRKDVMIGLPQEYFNRVRNSESPYSSPYFATTKSMRTFASDPRLFLLLQMIGTLNYKFSRRRTSPNHHISLFITTKRDFINNIYLFFVENFNEQGQISPFRIRVDQFHHFCIRCQDLPQ